MMRIVMMAVLGAVIAWGGESDLRFDIPKITRIINSTEEAFTINFDVNRLQSMITKRIESAVKEIKIDIAPGKTITAVKESVEVSRDDNSTYSWFGKTSDGKGEVVFSVRKGRMIGTVTIGTDRYTITPEGTHFKVTKEDPEMMVPMGEDTAPSLFKPEREPQLKLHDSGNDEAVESSAPERSVAEAAADGNTTVDVMILYTKAMKQKYGDDTELTIQHLFDLAKKAYADSQSKVKLHLAHLQQLPESSTLNDVKPDGNHLNEVASDGYVGYLRRKYHADMVSVMSRYTGGGTCGIGLLPTHDRDPMTSAFSIVMVRSASEGSGSYCSDMTLTHEMGHNFGCQHDRDHTNAGDDDALYPYAFGYDIPDEFATIMSYDRPGIPYFSNPNLTDKDSGDPIGVVDKEDNARTIRNSRAKIADNSEEIDESLESGDRSLAEGRLNSHKDRDAYFVTLGGQTSFRVAHPKYSNTWGYYINIYNSQTHTYIASCKDDCDMELDNGRYRVVVTYYNDHTGSYYNGDGDDYAVEVTTEYTLPPYPVSVINYLLQ